MKKIIAGLLVLLMLSLVAGCNIQKKLEEKAAEKLAEQMLGQSGGNVDIEGDKVTIKDKDGNAWTIGSSKWPTSDLAKSVPEFKKGEITSVFDSEKSVMIVLESVKEEDAAAYFETIKEKFTEDSYEMNSEDSLTYGAKNADDINVMLQYADESLSITVYKDA